MIQLRSTWDKGGSFGVHLYQKDPKSAKKWLSYGHFLTERLCDSIEKHMGQNGILWCLFVPKISKIGQEIAELGPFPSERLHDSIEKHMGQKGFLWCSVVPKGSKIFQEWQFTPARLHDSIENHKGQKEALGP